MKQLRKAARDYLNIRRGLGFKLGRHEDARLREFVLFLARKRSARITVNLALEWATQNANHQPYNGCYAASRTMPHRAKRSARRPAGFEVGRAQAVQHAA